MKIGVSTGCLYPELTEKSLALLTEGGFDLFEIFFNTYSELQDGFLNNLSDLCRVNNSEIVSLLKGEEISIPLRSGTGTVKLGFGNINGHEYFGIQRTDLSKERRLPTAPEETAEQQIDSKQAE